jgi:hypothetical protein
MRPLTTALASMAMVLSCGGRLESHSPDASAPDLLFRGDDGGGANVTFTCTPCPTDGPCGGCVALDGGGGFCVPFCTKDGFCTPDRNCAWVADPDGGFFPACLPRGSACGTPAAFLMDAAF